ncbi:Calpain-6 [Phlyctochytrium bullatum]|nr:Calpain-6 [Phlyctochytrium bullatum]
MSSTSVPTPVRKIVWIRASELAPEPALFRSHEPSANIIKGELGDCWIVSAVAALTIHPSLVAKVVPNVAQQDWVIDHLGKKRGNYYRDYHRSPDLHPGIFRFRFNRFGQWIEVVVDDYLPCTPDGKLIFARSRGGVLDSVPECLKFRPDPNEFWVSLLEKAYAKLRGCYHALGYVSPNSAYVDLSGNVAETIQLRSPEALEEFSDTASVAGSNTSFSSSTASAHTAATISSGTTAGVAGNGNGGGATMLGLFNLMSKAMAAGALMSCTMQPPNELALGKENESGTDLYPFPRRQRLIPAKTGLIFGFSYAITSVVSVRVRMSNLRRRNVQLVQLRNPWHSLSTGGEGGGSGGEFRGAWSDWSGEWQLVTKKEMKRLRLAFEDDGAFFMSFEVRRMGVQFRQNLTLTLPQQDFLKYFTTLTICRQFTANASPKPLVLIPVYSWQYYSSWSIASGTAGGCINHPDTFADNPQFLLHLPAPTAVLVSLMQREPGPSRLADLAAAAGGAPLAAGAGLLTIGFAVLRVEENRRYRFHSPGYPVATMVTYVNAREVFGRAKLDPGRYVIVPTTFAPGLEGEFMIRVQCHPASGARVACEPLVKDLPLGPGAGTLRRLGLHRAANAVAGRRGYPIGVLRVEVVGCAGLPRQKMFGVGADPYCRLRLYELHTPPAVVSPVTLRPAAGDDDVPAPVVETEPIPRALRRSTVKTRVARSTLAPEWHASFVWAVRRPRDTIVAVEVWNRLAGPADRFMGMTTVRVDDYMGNGKAGRTWEVEMLLRGREEEAPNPPPGGEQRGERVETKESKGKITLRVRYENSLENL